MSVCIVYLVTFFVCVWFFLFVCLFSSYHLVSKHITFVGDGPRNHPGGLKEKIDVEEGSCL